MTDSERSGLRHTYVHDVNVLVRYGVHIGNPSLLCSLHQVESRHKST